MKSNWVGPAYVRVWGWRGPCTGALARGDLGGGCLARFSGTPWPVAKQTTRGRKKVGIKSAPARSIPSFPFPASSTHLDIGHPPPRPDNLISHPAVPRQCRAGFLLLRSICSSWPALRIALSTTGLCLCLCLCLCFVPGPHGNARPEFSILTLATLPVPTPSPSTRTRARVCARVWPRFIIQDVYHARYARAQPWA